MLKVVEGLNAVLTGLSGVLLWPFRGIDPLWPLIFASLLCGVFMLWVFGRVSDQQAIAETRGKIRGNLLAIRLYQHDVGVVLRLQVRILKATLVYFRHSFRPILILLVPVFLILAQLNLYFSLRPLQPGESALVKARFASLSTGGPEEPQLKTPDGIRIELESVRIESEGEVAWRIRAVEPGQHQINVQNGDVELAKTVVVGGGWGRVSRLRTTSVLHLLMYPGEDAIPPEDRIDSIEISYPPLVLSLFGWHINWIILFLVFSLASAFVLRRPMGVEL